MKRAKKFYRCPKCRKMHKTGETCPAAVNKPAPEKPDLVKAFVSGHRVVEALQGKPDYSAYIPPSYRRGASNGRRQHVPVCVSMLPQLKSELTQHMRATHQWGYFSKWIVEAITQRIKREKGGGHAGK